MSELEDAARLFRMAAKLAELRVDDLAAELGVSRGTILNWTKGTTPVPVSALLRTCQLAGVRLDNLGGAPSYRLIEDETPKAASGGSHLRVVLGYLALGCLVFMAASTRSASPAVWWHGAQVVVQQVAVPGTLAAEAPVSAVAAEATPVAVVTPAPTPVATPVPQPRPAPTPEPVVSVSAPPVAVPVPTAVPLAAEPAIESEKSKPKCRVFCS